MFWNMEHRIIHIIILVRKVPNGPKKDVKDMAVSDEALHYKAWWLSRRSRSQVERDD
jgi:hypothetical protein